MQLLLACVLSILVAASLALAQEGGGPAFPPGEQPQEFEDVIQQMKFDKPTRIVGKLRSLDGYEDAIWIDWTHVYDGSRWRDLRDQREMMFKVLPRDADMMDFFRKLKPGTSLHMTVQMDADGNRRALSLDEGT
jgi:hypothetical protein